MAENVHHYAVFLPYHPDFPYNDHPPYYGTPGERIQQYQKIDDIASGKLSWREAFPDGSWEHPAIFTA